MLNVANEVWVAAALLHRENPSRSGFKRQEILARAGELHPGAPCRAGVQAHISGHCVATTKPSPNRHRMLHRNPDKSYRLFREGDPYHPGRQDGKTRPDREALPETYRYLVDWYESEYSPHRPRTLEEDPLMRLKGLGKDVWRSLGGGDAVIRWLRSDEIIPPPWEQATENNADRKTAVPSRSAGTRSFARVWERVCALEGETFYTKRKHALTYVLADGSGLRPCRRGRPINRIIPKEDLRKAWRRMPLTGPGEIQDLQGPAYIFAILQDPRISQ